MENGAALVKVDADDGLVMHCSPAESQRQLQELQAFVKVNMVEGVDYGTIPGTPKPSLWQPGAQKLCELYGLAHDFLDIETIQDWDKGFFVYRKRCVLTQRRSTMFIGAGVGSCNSREDRYAWRWLDGKKVPSNVEKNGLVTRDGKWGKMYRVPNPDVYSLVNTIEKMACKRALVHAVIGVTRSAGIFTQDVEDLPAEVFGQAEGTRPWEHGEVKDAEVVDAKKTDVIADYTKAITAAPTVADLQSMAEAIGKQPEPIKGPLRAVYDAKMKKLRAAVAVQAVEEFAEGAES